MFKVRILTNLKYLLIILKLHKMINKYNIYNLKNEYKPQQKFSYENIKKIYRLHI